MTKTGHCLCGKVSYALGTDKAIAAICHCKNCQRQAGSAFSIVVLAQTDQIEISGEVKTYHDTADSGAKLLRQFCPNCGSALFSRQKDSPSSIIIKAGTLDDTSWLNPAVHVWCNSAQPWFTFPEGAIKFPENAPSS